jgi:hypothetical protein
MRASWSWRTMCGNEQVSASLYENGQMRELCRVYPIDIAGRKIWHPACFPFGMTRSEYANRIVNLLDEALITESIRQVL